jgi:protein-S-isoprenylcysteine O-methyltransferase Ste14
MAIQPHNSDPMPLPPDAYVGIALVCAVIGEFALPLGLLPAASLVSPVTLIAAVLVVCGFAFEIAAARALAGGGASTRPNGPATALVTGGIFRRSRNPFYLGILLVVAGVMLAFSLDWGLLCVPLLWLALDRLVIPVEERRLERAFGQDYLTYAASTRRWL